MTQDNGSNLLKATNEDTSGPFFPIYFQDESLEDLTVLGPGIVGAPSGQHIILCGRVLDRHGNLANGVLMEFWQANAKGIYNSPANSGIQILILGSTAMAACAAPAESISSAPSCQARLIIVRLTSPLPCFPTVSAALLRRFSLRVIWPMRLILCWKSLDTDDQARLIARHDGQTDDGAEVYLLDIVMAGANETPFFDDFES